MRKIILISDRNHLNNW